MKYFFSCILIASLFSFSNLEDIYSVSVKNIDGSKVDLGVCRGKKILFVILPLFDIDSSLSIADLSGLQAKYSTSLVVIGIPSEESGFKNTDKSRLKSLYKNQRTNFILTEGMKVKKSNQQMPLFQWLTNKDKNRHFDQDVQGVGSKFFVDEVGELYAVMGAKTKLSDPVIDRILSRPLPKK